MVPYKFEISIQIQWRSQFDCLAGNAYHLTVLPSDFDVLLYLSLFMLIGRYNPFDVNRGREAHCYLA